MSQPRRRPILVIGPLKSGRTLSRHSPRTYPWPSRRRRPSRRLWITAAPWRARQRRLRRRSRRVRRPGSRTRPRRRRRPRARPTMSRQTRPRNPWRVLSLRRTRFRPRTGRDVTRNRRPSAWVHGQTSGRDSDRKRRRPCRPRQLPRPALLRPSTPRRTMHPRHRTTRPRRMATPAASTRSTSMSRPGVRPIERGRPTRRQSTRGKEHSRPVRRRATARQLPRRGSARPPSLLTPRSIVLHRPGRLACGESQLRARLRPQRRRRERPDRRWRQRWHGVPGRRFHP